MEDLENGGLLDDLVYAVIHSRAAYGYAMLAGSMSSVYNYFLLQTVINAAHASVCLLINKSDGGCSRVVCFSMTSPI